MYHRQELLGLFVVGPRGTRREAKSGYLLGGIVWALNLPIYREQFTLHQLHTFSLEPYEKNITDPGKKRGSWVRLTAGLRKSPPSLDSWLGPAPALDPVARLALEPSSEEGNARGEDVAGIPPYPGIINHTVYQGQCTWMNKREPKISPGVWNPEDRAAALIRSALGVPARLLEGNSMGGEDMAQTRVLLQS